VHVDIALLREQQRPCGKDTESSKDVNVARITLTRRRWVKGQRARLASSLSGLALLLALEIGVLQDYAYNNTPIFCDGMDDDVGASFLCALSNDEIRDFSKPEKAFIWNPGEVIGSRAIASLSAITRSASLRCREQHPLPLKLLPAAEHRASGNSSTDPA
jgi:hypothetical protein